MNIKHLAFVSVFALSTGCPEKGVEMCDPHNDPVSVVGHSTDGPLLLLEVSYAGGCEEHDIELWWAGEASNTTPSVIPLALQHDANGDTCNALITETIAFDVSEILNLGENELSLEFYTGFDGEIANASLDHTADIRVTQAEPSNTYASVRDLFRGCGIIE